MNGRLFRPSTVLGTVGVIFSSCTDSRGGGLSRKSLVLEVTEDLGKEYTSLASDSMGYMASCASAISSQENFITRVSNEHLRSIWPSSNHRTEFSMSMTNTTNIVTFTRRLSD